MRRRCETREAVAWGLAAFLLLLWLRRPACPYVWHGGAPGGEPAGSCWAGPDGYAMCTPSLAIDLVIESGDDGVVLVKRGDNGKYATMGGFVDVGELPRDAVARELREETNLELVGEPELLGVFGDPRRDERRHTVSAVYVARTAGEPKVGSDARAVVVERRDARGKRERLELRAAHLDPHRDARAARVPRVFAVRGARAAQLHRRAARPPAPQDRGGGRRQRQQPAEVGVEQAAPYAPASAARRMRRMPFRLARACCTYCTSWYAPRLPAGDTEDRKAG